jgi:hypothetical protein
MQRGSAHGSAMSRYSYVSDSSLHLAWFQRRNEPVGFLRARAGCITPDNIETSVSRRSFAVRFFERWFLQRRSEV